MKFWSKILVLPNHHRLFQLAKNCCLSGEMPNRTKWLIFPRISETMDIIGAASCAASLGTPKFKTQLKDFFENQMSMSWHAMASGRQLREIKGSWCALSPKATCGGSRRLETLRAQLRLGWSPLRSTTHHFAAHDDKCPHCNEVETREHYFLKCGKYRDIRSALFASVRAALPVELNATPIECKCLLGGWGLSSESQTQIRTAVDIFIVNSHRFD